MKPGVQQQLRQSYQTDVASQVRIGGFLMLFSAAAAAWALTLLTISGAWQLALVFLAYLT